MHLHSTAKKRKQYRLNASKPSGIRLDMLSGYIFFFVILLYVVFFAIVRTKGFVWTNFNIAYMVILIPIWICDGFKNSLESLTRRSYLSAREDLSKVTVVIACKDGEDVLDLTLKDLVMRFDPSQIIVALNGSTDNSLLIAQGYGARVLNIKQPIGKVRAINKSLRYVNTPYALLLDDDTLIGQARIPTGLLEEGYDGVAFRVLVRKSNWLSKLQLYEYRKSTDVGKRYHNNKASVVNVSGAIGLFTIKQLRRQIARHSGEFSGEDLQRTLLIHLAQDGQGVVLTDATVHTQPPTTVINLYRQRVFGWYPGLYANFKNYLKVLTRDHMSPALRFDAFYNVFLVMTLDIVRLLSLPILILYPWYFIIMYFSYLAFEIVAYIRCGSEDPLWVLLVYPFYGLFGFITRVCAFATFCYRRLVVRFGKKRFLDDFRAVRSEFKVSAVFVTLIFLMAMLALNVATFYIKPVLNLR